MDTKKHSWHGPKQIGIMFYTAVLFLIGTSIIGGNNNTVFPMLAEIRGWDVNILNLVSGIACILKAVGILAFAGITQKIGSKLLIGITLLISAALMLVFGGTSNLGLIIASILILGFLGGAYEKNGAMVLTANWWPTKKGLVLGLTTMGIVAMNFLYVPYMPVLIGKFGPFGAFGIVAAIMAVVAVIGLVAVKNNPEEAGEYPDGLKEGALDASRVAQMMKEYKSPLTTRKVLADKDTWFIGLGSGFAFMAVMSYIASAIPAMLSYGYDPKAATSIFAAGGIMGIIGSFVFGIIDQKIGTKKTFIVYFVFIIIGFLVLMGMPKGLAFCWISGIIIFAAQGALCNLLPSYVATKYGRWDYNAGYKVIGFMFEVFAGIGVMMTGIFSSFSLMYTIDLVLMIVGLIFMILSNDKFIGKAN